MVRGQFGDSDRSDLAVGALAVVAFGLLDVDADSCAGIGCEPSQTRTIGDARQMEPAVCSGVTCGKPSRSIVARRAGTAADKSASISSSTILRGALSMRHSVEAGTPGGGELVRNGPGYSRGGA